MTNIYQRLGIEPTCDFDKVRAAFEKIAGDYIKIVSTHAIQSPDPEFLKYMHEYYIALVNEFHKVDSQEKLDKYYKDYSTAYNNGTLGNSVAVDTTPVLDDKTGYIEVYVPVSFSDDNGWAPGATGLQPELFAKNFNFPEFAKDLSSEIRTRDNRRGLSMSYSDAVAEANKQEYLFWKVIACIRIPLESLVYTQESNRGFYTLKAGAAATLSEKNIISITPMYDLQNKFWMKGDVEIQHQLWPKNIQIIRTSTGDAELVEMSGQYPSYLAAKEEVAPSKLTDKQKLEQLFKAKDWPAIRALLLNTQKSELFDLLVWFRADGFPHAGAPIYTLFYDCKAEDDAEIVKILEIIFNHLTSDDQKRLMNLSDEYEETLLRIAASHDYGQVIRFLIKQGMDLNKQDDQQRTALHIACQCKARHAMVALVEAGAKLDLQDIKKQTPLHYTAQHQSNFDMFEYLLKFGANSNLPDGSNKTAQMIADQKGFNDWCLKRRGNAEKLINLIQENKWDEVKALLGSLSKDDLYLTCSCVVRGKHKDKWTVIHHLTSNKAYEAIAVLESIVKRLTVSQNKLLLSTDDGSIPTPLFYACVHQDGCHAVDILIKAGVDVNFMDEDGNTALHKACRHGAFEVVKLLLEKGKAQVNPTSKALWTPLHMAVQHSHPDIVMLLLSHGANLAPKNSLGMTAYEIAQQKGNSEILAMFRSVDHAKQLKDLISTKNWSAIEQLLLDPRVDVFKACCYSDNAGRFILHDLASASDDKAVDFLRTIFSKLTPAQTQELLKLTDKEGYTPLHIAAASNNTEAIQLMLVAGGLDVESCDNQGNTALHCACQKGALASAKILVDIGKAHINAINKRGESPLHQCAEYNQIDVAGYLLSQDATNTNILTADQKTALMIAESQGHEAMAIMLRNACQKPVDDATHVRHAQELVRCLEGKDRRAIDKIFAEQGFDLFQTCIVTPYGNGKNLVHYLLESRDPEAIRFLEKVILENLRPEQKRTLVNILDKKGKTPLHHVHNVEVMRMLLKAGADANYPDASGETLLHQYAFRGDLDFIRVLVEEGKAVVNAVNPQTGQTPLHSCAGVPHWYNNYNDAIKRGQVAEYLLTHGADPTVRDNSQKTPLMLALAPENKNEQVASKLRNCGVPIARQDDEAEQQENAAELLKLIRTENWPGCERLLSQPRFNWYKVFSAKHLVYKELSTHYESVRDSRVGSRVVGTYDVEVERNTGESGVLYYLVKNTSSESVNLLEKILSALTPEQKQVILNMGGEDDAKLLHIAAKNKNFAAVECLIRHGARVTCYDSSLATPLHRACSQKGTIAIVKALVSPESINAENSAHWTPLHYAAYAGDLETVQFLLEHGADPEKTTKDGKTAWMLAEQKGNIEIGNLIVNKQISLRKEKPSAQVQLDELEQKMRDAAIRIGVFHQAATMQSSASQQATGEESRKHAGEHDGDKDHTKAPKMMPN